MKQWKLWGAAVALLLAGSVVAADYPAKPVRIIAPYAAGGGVDMLTRMLAKGLSDIWKQPVVVENRPGAGAIIGTEAVAKAEPDGYTLLVSASTIAVSPLVYAKLPYDVARDFAPVTLLAQTPYVMAVNASLPVNNFAELQAYARANPARFNYGSAGNGTVGHLLYELVRGKANLQATVVHYKGSNPALQDLLGGQVSFVMDTPAAVMPHVRSQKLRAIAVASGKRSAAVPQLPTLKEAGVPELDVQAWIGLFAPAGTPEPVVRKLHADVVAALATPAVAERLTADGFEVVTMQPAAFSAFVRAEMAKWKAVVNEAKLKFDQ